jgi:quinohemoprotein ethanol dehydrogenase
MWAPRALRGNARLKSLGSKASRAQVLCATAIVAAACSRSNGPPPAAPQAPPPAPRAYGAVSSERLLAADSEPGQWMSYGRTYSEQRYSPLAQIDTRNVGRLGLAWFADFDTHRGQESTPLEVDGTIYVTTAWSKVRAYDAKSGAPLWAYDPSVPGEWGVNACCDVVNRGAAVWNGKIYLGTLDGRLIALDAATGKPVWQVQTTDPRKAYSITGAPRVALGKVLIGQAGSEFSQRGYISAYDAETGKLDWRWYVVPGNPADGFENKQMALAAKTWGGQWWKTGGGGAPWDAITYDPQTGYVLIGTGNGAPWPAEIRSPGNNDNLYLASIVALRLTTGEYVWHYQMTPHESWDYDETQQIVLADLTLDGRKRHVAMQASKNGYFYVLDAATGKLISAEGFVPNINWSFGIDLATGRPRINPAARYDRTGKGFLVVPTVFGAHSWQPMSYNPATGLVYIPAVYANYPLVATHRDDNPMGQKLSISFAKGLAMYRQPGNRRIDEGSLLAWDPVKQREAWRVSFGSAHGGGTLTTAGGLVFQGNAQGDAEGDAGNSQPEGNSGRSEGDPQYDEFAAYRADNGSRLWSMRVETGVGAGPVTFEVDGEQYVAVVAGSRMRGDFYAPNHSRLLVFKLGGTAHLPPALPPPKMTLDPPPEFGTPSVLRHGEQIYDRFCGTCHGTDGQSRGLFPDLRYSATLASPVAFDAIVLDGALTANGMVSFRKALTPQDADAVRAYVVSRAHDALKDGPGGIAASGDSSKPQ